ncbi:MAG: 2-amino-4-hydroxy-6-hydroxymethyldihydropteridine diphosphokinase [Candidatus Coatesbacteria bacterium]|nr:2-amino-4-hydroxy-6-hydroxymethyldihydropteridine diphosphokinase [Candidatus Coatesbacteria bacterium]
MSIRRALIGLGSNLGDRRANLFDAAASLADEPDLKLLALSRFYENPAVGLAAGSGDFLNACALLSTGLGIGELGRRLAVVEEAHGRDEDRRRGDGARRLDLDLLYLGGLIGEEGGYIVPHPRLRLRAFVLEPACEIAPCLCDPRDGRTVLQLWRRLRRRLS